MEMSREAVVTAARKHYETYLHEDGAGWDEIGPALRETLVERMRLALEDAVPSLMAQAWDEGHDAGMEAERMIERTENPYR